MENRGNRSQETDCPANAQLKDIERSDREQLDRFEWPDSGIYLISIEYRRARLLRAYRQSSMFPVKIASRVLYYIVPIDNFSLHRQKVYGYLIIPFPLDGLWPDQSGSEMLDPCLLVGRKRRSFCFQDAADDIVKISLFILRLEFPISCVLSLIESKKNLVFQLKAV